jgi:putative resolvase
VLYLGVNWMVLRGQGRSIEVVNQAENGMEDVVADLTSILSSFCTRLYGQRRAKRKTEQVVQRLEANGDIDAIS